MVELMNRTIKHATIKSYEYLDMAQLRAHVLAFVQSYNFQAPEGITLENTVHDVTRSGSEFCDCFEVQSGPTRMRQWNDCFGWQCSLALETGPNPTERGKLGSKRHIIVDAQGIPQVVLVSGANRHDSGRFSLSHVWMSYLQSKDCKAALQASRRQGLRLRLLQGLPEKAWNPQPNRKTWCGKHREARQASLGG